MNPLRICARNGRITLDVPTDLPEGSVVDLTIDESGDGLGVDERARLHAALEQSLQRLADGEVIPAAEILAAMRLRARKRSAD